MSNAAPKLGCIGTIMLAGFIGGPLDLLGLPQSWAYGIGVVAAIAGFPLLDGYLSARSRHRAAVAHARSTPPQPNPPAGWYMDPTGQHTRCWWDGSAWTDHVSDGQPLPPTKTRDAGIADA